MPSLGVLPIVGIVLLVSAVAFPSLAADPSGDGTGTLGVTVLDPSETESPTPSPSPSASETPRPGGGGSGGSGGTPAPSDSPSPEPTSIPEGGGWIVVGGLEATAHGEFDPLRGWVDASLTISNKSQTESVSGTVTFRLYNTLGTQIGSKATHTVTGIVAGETQRVNARLVGVGQWPVLRVVATFAPDASTSETPMDPIERESWIIAFPWVLLVGLVLLLASGIIVGLRRGSFARFGSRT